MDKRINLELRGRQPAEVRDLDLSGVKTGGDIDIECFTSEFANLETLDLSNSTITNLRGFPKLKKLDLSYNRLSRGPEILKECPNLTQIILNNNKIKELEVLEPLGHLKHLTHLELGLGDELPAEVGYRAKVFSMIPSLLYLDQEDIDGNVEEEEEEEHVNGNGLAEEDDDLDDGDDELEDEEAEVEDEEEESDVEEGVTSGLDTLYPNSGLLNHQDYREEEEMESTRGRRSPTESTRGKKRKLEPEPEG